MRGTRTLGLAVALLAAGAAGDALAFNSYGKITAEHGAITDEAGSNRGLVASAISRLQKEVRTVDWNDTKTIIKLVSPAWQALPVPRPYIVTSDTYDYIHHFDRGKTGGGAWRSVATTFDGSKVYVKNLKDAAITQWKAGNKDDAFESLGQALHAIQDVISHSNAVDLPGADQDKMATAIFDHTIAMPAGLKLTSFLENDIRGGLPKDDPLDYEHDKFSKDTAVKNAEAKTVVGASTKFQLAKNLASIYSQRLLLEFQIGLTAAEWNAAKAYASLSPDPGEDLYQWASAGTFLPGVGITLSSSGTQVIFGPTALSSAVDVAVMGVPMHFFKELDDIENDEGRTMGIFREIRPMDALLSAAATGEIEVDLTEIAWLDPDTLDVFYMDPATDDWEPVSGASVFLGGSTAIANFDIADGGVYAIGGVAAVPEPSTALLLGVGLLGLARFRAAGPG